MKRHKGQSNAINAYLLWSLHHRGPINNPIILRSVLGWYVQKST
jgi:hypothetical protein